MADYDLDEVLQQALDRLTLLADAGSALASTLDLREALRRVGRIITHRLGDWCCLDVVDETGSLERACVTHHDESVVTRTFLGALPVPAREADRPLARVLRGEGPLLLGPEALEPTELTPGELAERQLELFRELGARSAVLAPLRSRREVLGALTVARTRPGPQLEAGDLALVEDLAHRIALAVDNARLHRSAQRIAERLQLSLLPDLPDLGPLELAADYAPAQAAAQVGGDWYDCFRLPQGDPALIIGDVAGHDLRATVVMSQIRNMLRGIACDRQEPPERILHRLDVAVHHLGLDSTATCVYALVQGGPEGPWQLHHSSAGHPPPLLVARDGNAELLDGAQGLMLGVDAGQVRWSLTSPLPPGSTLVFYTDGLVERRGESFGHGLTRLRRHAASLAREPVRAFVSELVTGLARERADDVAVLALRLPGPA